jgi:hypothetical protein
MRDYRRVWKRKHLHVLHIMLTGSQRFYNDATFSDVTILMLGQRPMPSKAARKSVTPVYTFHAHRSSFLLDLLYLQGISIRIQRYDCVF